MSLVFKLLLSAQCRPYYRSLIRNVLHYPPQDNGFSCREHHEKKDAILELLEGLQM
jgi:hypothetical protein